MCDRKCLIMHIAVNISQVCFIAELYMFPEVNRHSWDIRNGNVVYISWTYKIPWLSSPPTLHITSPAVLIMSHSGWVFPSSASPKTITFIQAFTLPKINCIIHIVITFKLDYQSLYCIAQNKVVNWLLVAVPSRKYPVLVFNIYWFFYKWLKSVHLKFPSPSCHDTRQVGFGSWGAWSCLYPKRVTDEGPFSFCRFLDISERPFGQAG